MRTRTVTERAEADARAMRPPGPVSARDRPGAPGAWPRCRRRDHMEEDQPDRLLGRPAVRPGDPGHGRADVGSQHVRARPRPSPPPSRRTPHRVAQHLARNSELRLLDPVRVGHHAADVGVAGTRHRGQPRAHQPARAGLRGGDRQTAGPRERQHDLLDRARVLREEVAAELGPQGRLHASRRASAPSSANRSTWIS